MNVYNPKDCTFIDKQYVGEQKIETAYIGSQEKNTKNGMTDLRLASLAKYVPLSERVEDIAAQLQTVRCAQDFKMVVRQIVDMYIPQQKAVIISKPFRETLMAFVTYWQLSDDSVYRQCLEVYKE